MSNFMLTVLVFAVLACERNASSDELPKDLSVDFCGGPELSLFFDNVSLCETGEKHQGALFCGCNCTNDLNSLTLFENDAPGKAKVLLMVDEISNYKILKTRTNGYNDVSFIVWKDSENHSLGDIIDTMIFNGSRYIKKTGHTSKIVLNDEKNFKEESDLIEKNLAVFFQSEKSKSPLSKEYANSFSLFKSGKKSEAAQSLFKAVGPKPWTIDKSNVAIFNDLGFFLEEAGQFQEAVDILTDVIANFPDRTPAYLNLADAYTGLRSNDKAKENYIKYADLMTKSGKQSKISKRVIDIVGK